MVHIPRCGGFFIQELAKQLGILQQIFKGDVDSHFKYCELPTFWQTHVCFTVVRNPIDWVKSRWSHALEIEAFDNYRHYGIHRDFDSCVVPSLNQTVDNIIRRESSLITRTYRYMSDGVQYIIALEKLEKQLRGLLERYEEVHHTRFDKVYNRVKLQNGSIPINSTAKTSKYLKEEIDNQLQDKLRQQNKEAFSIWEEALACKLSIS